MFSPSREPGEGKRILGMPYATIDERERADEDEDEDEDEDKSDGEMAFVFVRPNPPGSQLENTVVARVTLSPAKLVVETMSRERAARFREQIEQACGSRVSFESSEERDVAEMLEQAHEGGRTAEARRPLGEGPEPPPEVADAIRELKAKAYRPRRESDLTTRQPFECAF